MNDFSILEKLKILTKIIDSSPLFLFCCMLCIAFCIFFIVCIKKDIIVNRWVIIITGLSIGIMLVINYNSVIFDLIDNLFNDFFMALYFPNLTIYITLLFISNGFFIYSLFSRKLKNTHKIVNMISSIIIDIFLFLITDIVSKNSINIYDSLEVYSNSSLLVLLQLSTAIFTSWILLSLLISAHDKLKKYDKDRYPKMREIIFDDII